MAPYDVVYYFDTVAVGEQKDDRLFQRSKSVLFNGSIPYDREFLTALPERTFELRWICFRRE